MIAHDHDHDEDRAARVDWGVWRRVARFALPHRRQLAVMGAAAISTATCDVSFALVTRRVIDDAVAASAAGAVRASDFAPHAAVYLALVLGLAVSVRTFIRATGRVRAAVAHDVRAAGFEKLQRLEFAYFDQRPVGWLMARMTADCDRLSQILAWGTLDFVWGSVVLTGIVGVMLWLHWPLALVSLAVLPVVAALSVYFQRRILKSSRAVRGLNSAITATYNESLSGVRTTKAFVRERENLDEFRALTARMQSASVRNALQSAVYLPLVLVLSSAATGLALAYGGVSVASAGISLGTLIAFLAYARQFFDPVQELAARFTELQMAQAAAERIVGLVETEPAIRDSEAVLARLAAHRPAPGLAPDGLPDRIGTVRFRDVDFAYGGGERVLTGFDLEVRPGETIALVGATGGGKSTIVSLLCRFYEPTGGRVELDGTDYRDRSLDWLRSKLGIVLQTPHLFRGSVLENVRYGRLDATDDEVREAGRLVGLDAVLERHEPGWATEVGAGGALLSTGERQLVSFARALLADPELLVLDEATSSVDTETERRIQQALARVLEGRTSFVIAHRLSTVRDAERILVIDAGRIVEQGSHTELLCRRGRYRELVTRQLLGVG